MRIAFLVGSRILCNPPTMKLLMKSRSHVSAWVFLLFAIVTHVKGLITDVCISKAEDLSLHCSNDEIIVATKASFGTMKLGRCITMDIQIGCGADVLFLVDRWCSGRRSCEVDVPNTDLVKANECTEGLMMYLEVEYECQRVPRDMSREGCRRGQGHKVLHPSGDLFSVVTDETGCGSSHSPWLIEGAPGQRVNVSMLDFAYTPTSSGAKTSTMTCEPYGYIVERKLGINRTVCGGVARRSHVYMSATSAVEINAARSNRDSPPGPYVLHYEVIGCPDARPPEHAWYKRTGDTAEMGCEWSDLSWQMKCVGSRWIGMMGNCSVARIAEASANTEEFELHPVLSLGLIIGLASLIALLIIIIAVGFYCMKKRKPTNSDQPLVASKDGKLGQSMPSTMPRHAQVNSATIQRTLTAGRHLQYIPGTVEGTTKSDLLHGWDTATANRGQQGIRESEYLAPCLTGSYLAEKYGAPIYDTVGTRNGTGERNSSAGDGDWVQEANFQFVAPQV